MIVATHNPSTLVSKEIEIKVPHGKYKVKKLVQGKLVDALADVACNDEVEEKDFLRN